MANISAAGSLNLKVSQTTRSMIHSTSCQPRILESWGKGYCVSLYFILIRNELRFTIKCLTVSSLVGYFNSYPRPMVDHTDAKKKYADEFKRIHAK